MGGEEKKSLPPPRLTLLYPVLDQTAAEERLSFAKEHVLIAPELLKPAQDQVKTISQHSHPERKEFMTPVWCKALSLGFILLVTTIPKRPWMTPDCSGHIFKGALDDLVAPSASQDRQTSSHWHCRRVLSTWKSHLLKEAAKMPQSNSQSSFYLDITALFAVFFYSSCDANPS